MKVAMPLAKNVLAPLGLTAAMSAIDGGIQKKMRGYGIKLMIENEDMDNIMNIIKALEKSGILLDGVGKTIENEVKEQKGGFLSMLLGPLGASLLGNLLTGGKGIMRAGEGIMRAGEGIMRAGEGAKKSLLPFHPLTNFDIMDYYKNEPRFNGVYSRDNLPKTIKKGAYVINLDEYDDVGTHWIALYVRNNCIYFDSFGVEHIPNEIKQFIGSKNIISNIFRLQAYDSIMRGYFCIAFIDFMFADKTLLQFTNLFSPYDFKKNDKIVVKMFK